MNNKSVSIVIPVLNEEKGITSFLDEQLLPVLESLKTKYNFFIVLVDDGSTDRTIQKVEATRLFSGTRTHIVAFSRNFGKEVALSCGIELSISEKGLSVGEKGNFRGADAVVLIDGDGQHPANAIPKMLEKWEQGADVVTAVRKSTKHDGRRHKLSSKLFYKLYRCLGNGDVREGEMDFKVIDRSVAEEFLRFSEHNRITRGLIDYLGFKKAYVEVKILKRIGGKPSYNFRKLTTMAADSIISSSRVPLIFFGLLGIGITFFSFLLGIFILIQQYILRDPLGLDWSGAVAMCVFIAFLVGIVLTGQAVTGLYISQIHIETKNRPLYIIDRKKSRL